jgi:hypothetical protein
MIRSSTYSNALSTQDLSNYNLFSQVVRNDALHPSNELRDSLNNHPFKDKVRISAVPMLLTSKQNTQLQQACRQYVKALSMLFHDIVLGECKIIDHPRGIPKIVIDAILCASPTKSLQCLRELWKGRSINELTFMLGADIVLDKENKFHLLELNIGNLGGTADMHFVPKEYLQLSAQEQIRQQATEFTWNSTGPDFFLAALEAQHSIQLENESFVAISPHKNTKKYATDLQKGIQANLEEYRWSQSLQSKGVSVVWEDAEINFAIDRTRIIINHENKTSTQQWWQEGGGVLLNAPCVADLLDNKLLLAYLAQIVNFYLKEQIIIQPPESTAIEVCGSSSNVSGLVWTVGNMRKLLTLPQFLENGLVIKTGRGVCGEEVMIWPPGSRPRISELIANIPNFFSESVPHGSGRFLLMQRFIDVKQIDGHRVDLRPITYCIGSGEAVVSPAPIGRAQRVERWRSHTSINHFKNNVAKGASILPVFVLNTTNM